MRWRDPVLLGYVAAVAGLFVAAAATGTIHPRPWTVVIVTTCFLCELMDSSLGMGYGTTLTPLLLLAGYAPLQLVPTILVSELLSGFMATFFHARAGNVRLRGGSIHVRAGVILSFCSVLGVAGGVHLAFHISKTMLTRVIGVIILLAGTVILLSAGRTVTYRGWKVGLLAIVASFNKAVSGGGYGPLMTSGQLLAGIDGRAAVAITSLAEGFTCLAGATLFLLQGKGLDVDLLVPVVTGALLSVPLSAGIVRVTREESLKRLIGIVTLGLGVFTLVRAF